MTEERIAELEEALLTTGEMLADCVGDAESILYRAKLALEKMEALSLYGRINWQAAARELVEATLIDDQLPADGEHVEMALNKLGERHRVPSSTADRSTDPVP